MGKEHKEDKHEEEKQEYEGTSKIDAAIGKGVTNGAKIAALGAIATVGIGIATHNINVRDIDFVGSPTFIAGAATVVATGLSAIKGTLDGAARVEQTKDDFEELVEKNQKLGQENKILKTAVTNTITSALAQGTLVAPERGVGAPT